MSHLSDPSPLVKPWWQSKTILGIITLLLAFLFERMQAGVTEQEVTDLVTLAAGLAGAVFAIFGRIKAKKELRITMPGGDFNPNAEVRKPKSYKFPKTGGYFRLSAIWAGVLWLVAMVVIFSYFAALQQAHSTEEIGWREMVERRDAMLERRPAPQIVWREPVDNRPFLVRLIDSIRCNFAAKPGYDAEGNLVVTEVKAEIKGGAEF